MHLTRRSVFWKPFEASPSHLIHWTARLAPSQSFLLRDLAYFAVKAPTSYSFCLTDTSPFLPIRWLQAEFTCAISCKESFPVLFTGNPANSRIELIIVAVPFGAVKRQRWQTHQTRLQAIPRVHDTTQSSQQCGTELRRLSLSDLRDMHKTRINCDSCRIAVPDATAISLQVICFKGESKENRYT